MVKAKSTFESEDNVIDCSHSSFDYDRDATQYHNLLWDNVTIEDYISQRTWYATVFKVHVNYVSYHSWSSSWGMYPHSYILVQQNWNTVENTEVSENNSWSCWEKEVTITSRSWLLYSTERWYRYWKTISYHIVIEAVKKNSSAWADWTPKAVVELGKMWFIITFTDVEAEELENRWYVLEDHYSSTSWDITAFYWYVTVIIWWKKYKLPTIWEQTS